MIIALIGEKRSGKSTVGDILYRKYGFYQLAFADKIKEVASILFNWDSNYIENHKEEIDSRWGISPRDFLTFFGTNFMQLQMSENFKGFKESVNRDFWAKRTIEEIENIRQKEDCNFVITDTRFIHEYKFLKNYARRSNEKIVFIKVKRPELKNNYQSHDLTETEIKDIEEDYLIEANSIDELNVKANKLLAEIFFDLKYKI